MRRQVSAGLVALVALASACVPKVVQPEVWLGGASLASVGLSGGVVDVQLSIYNPNRFALRASGLTYAVEVADAGSGGEEDGWLEFTEGRIDRHVEVAAGDTAVVVVPVEFTYRGMGEALRRLLDRGSFDYRVSGIVALEGPVERDIRYRHSGAVTPTGIR